MKILLIHNRYRLPGGEDSVLHAETTILQRAGHQVEVYERDNDEIDASGIIRAASLALNTIWSRSSYHGLQAILARYRPDIAHFHNTFPQISPAGYDACSDVGVPVVQTLHNYRLLCPSATFYRDNAFCDKCLEGGLHHSVIHACYRNSRAATAVTAAMLSIHRLRGTWVNKVDRYIALTEFGRRIFITGGLPAHKITVKPNFLSDDPGIGAGNGTYVVFVGRLSPEKGLRTLLTAWRKLPHIPLVIAGDGPLRAELEAEAVRHDLRNIIFKGHLNKAETFSTIQGARFLVFPSEWPEGFGLTIAESFACGVPVLSSDSGCLPEIVTPGRTGFLFHTGAPRHLAETVSRAWSDPVTAAALGKEARAEYIARYTGERNYRLLIDIYEDTIRRCKGTPAAQEAMALSA